jgi:hypothetical protein
MVIGILVGILYQRWVDAPPSASAVESTPSPGNTPQPIHKKRPQANAPAQQ